MTAPLPPGLPLDLDASVRTDDGGRVLTGGSPRRLVRLSDAGAGALPALLDGTGSAAARRLGRRLVEGGLAHPRPPRAPAVEATIVIPVRDRPEALARCLAAGADHPVLVVDDGSADAAAIAAVCAAHDARVLRHERPGGPAAARNRALAEAETELVAFLDSDCVAPAGWVEALAGHFDDPLVAAVAPRVRPLGAPGPVSAYVAARSPLDMGERPATVAPGAPVAYVPTAALVVRRAAIEAFDEALRYGEDVDLVWRLHDAGWRVRYDPSIEVGHEEPSTWRGLVARRYRYGTSAGPLARRHPGRLAPARVAPLPAAAVSLLLARRPLPALACAVAGGALAAHRASRAGVPARRALAWSARSLPATAESLGRAGAMLAAPALLIRPRAAALLALPPLLEYARRRPRLDPLRWTLACLADDAAYGAGVWRGSLRARTAEPLIPRLG